MVVERLVVLIMIVLISVSTLLYPMLSCKQIFSCLEHCDPFDFKIGCCFLKDVERCNFVKGFKTFGVLINEG